MHKPATGQLRGLLSSGGSLMDFSGTQAPFIRLRAQPVPSSETQESISTGSSDPIGEGRLSFSEAIKGGSEAPRLTGVGLIFQTFSSRIPEGITSGRFWEYNKVQGVSFAGGLTRGQIAKTLLEGI